ncbi:purine nucleosidase [Saccharopolyspora kobensis]|uniref:Purine nucleosidase n=1 Tax=Saccharopolyspora kobensis TaxID=146035 RepID=A0A1H5U543_9PSEU|nr:nucleoside hydrolase [Saccharopolyspora kobensis]SEF69381.1 purine nucleosidase [Saccharopolyspora kobensis]SFC77917.1 purine nucleosidase [Saccharopolyspora kobensis]
MNASHPRPVYLDCDPGVDDALALGYLVASPAVRLVGVGTVYGNCSAEVATRNACDWLAVMGAPEVPVAMGASNPSRGEYRGAATWIHGERGTGAVTLPVSGTAPVSATAPELLVELARKHAGNLEIITVGPLTNLAQALAIEPGLPGMVKQLTMMGGAALHPGNISPVTEANVGKDPESARLVFQQPWPMTMVGLDVTMTNTLEEEHRLALQSSGSRSARLLAEVVDFYFDFHVDVYGRRCSALHDPLAAAIGAGGLVPSLAPLVDVDVDDTRGPGRGQTICSLGGKYRNYPPQDGAHCRVALEIGAPVAPHLVDVLSTLP